MQSTAITSGLNPGPGCGAADVSRAPATLPENLARLPTLTTARPLNLSSPREVAMKRKM